MSDFISNQFGQTTVDAEEEKRFITECDEKLFEAAKQKRLDSALTEIIAKYTFKAGTARTLLKIHDRSYKPAAKIKVIKNQRFTKEEIDKIISYHKETGFGPTKIHNEKILGDRTPSTATISNLLREHVEEYKVAALTSLSSSELSLRNSLVSDYNNGMSVQEIVSKLELAGSKKSRKAVEVILKEGGVDISQGKTKEEIEIIYEAYLKYGTEKAVIVLKELGMEKISKTTVRRLLIENNLETRDNTDCYRTYEVDDNIFDQNTSEIRSLIGFIMGDGWVREVPTPLLAIEIKLTDENYLGKVKVLFKTNKPLERTVHFDKRSDTYNYGTRLTVFGEKIVTKLKSYGITPNKSLTLKPILDKFSLEEQIAIWQGCVDADGSLFLRDSKYQTLELCGSKDTVEGFREFIEKSLKITETVFPYKNIFRVRYQRREDAIAIATLLYKDATLFLDRKKLIADEWMRK